MKHLKKFVQMSSWVSMGNVAIRQSQLGLRRNGFIVFFLLLGLCFHSFVHAQPGHPYKLSGEMVLDGDVDDYSISPDSSRVVYLADQDTDEVQELYSVPIGGGTPVKLNGPFVTGGDVWPFSISPDSSRVVYRADQGTDEVYELFGVKIKTDTCLGDYEPDGDVDGSDLAVFAADFGKTDCSGDCEGDFDGDNDVDGSDLAVFAADFGRTDCP